MMEEASQIVILVTAPDEEARRIGELLLNQKEAACVNIVPGVSSLFWWQGKLDSARESLMLIKTSASLLTQVTETVKKAHSYEVPEIIALPIIGGSEDYLKWMDNVVEPGDK